MNYRSQELEVPVAVRKIVETETGSEPSRQTGTISLRGVSKAYGQVTAVDELNLEVAAGEFISLLGPSGCGKTTTLRLIAGFERPDAGAIEISGHDVVGEPPYRRNVNTVFQAYALFPHMSIAENVAYGLQQKRTAKSEIRQRVVEALDMVQMRSFADRRPTQLSGGQQQRIALARALINRPAVLLLDEPLGALDRQLREEMQLELKLLQSRLGITFVFVTHDQGEALSMSDRIAIMRDGHIEQLDDADTIYASPATAYVAGFVGQQNFLPGSVVASAGSGISIKTPHGVIHSSKAAVSEKRLGEGDHAQATVRPEFVDIAPASARSKAGNSVTGSLIGISHLGETMQYLVQLADDTTMLVRRPTPEAPRMSVGDPVACTWHPESVTVYPSPSQSQIEENQ